MVLPSDDLSVIGLPHETRLAKVARPANANDPQNTGAEPEEPAIRKIGLKTRRIREAVIIGFQSSLVPRPARLSSTRANFGRFQSPVSHRHKLEYPLRVGSPHHVRPRSWSLTLGAGFPCPPWLSAICAAPRP